MQIAEISDKKVLYAALNWGMGHVSRSVSIIKQLIEQGNAVVFAGSEKQHNIIRLYFPQIDLVVLEDYPFKFGGSGNFGTDILFSLGSLSSHMKREFNRTESLVNEIRADVVISDHRYGFRSTQVPSVFVTHQLNLPVRWYQQIANVIHHKLIRRFDAVWLVDDAKNRFAGKLSENRKGFNAYYIGPRSRFEFNQNELQANMEVIVVSGPKPYDQLLLEEIRELVTYQELKIIGRNDLQLPDYLTKNKLESDWKRADELLKSSSRIISRSGYSTIMDAYFLKKDLVMIPTKGQTEQKYLYERWKDHANFSNQSL